MLQHDMNWFDFSNQDNFYARYLIAMGLILYFIVLPILVATLV